MKLLFEVSMPTSQCISNILSHTLFNQIPTFTAGYLHFYVCLVERKYPIRLCYRNKQIVHQPSTSCVMSRGCSYENLASENISGTSASDLMRKSAKIVCQVKTQFLHLHKRDSLDEILLICT